MVRSIIILCIFLISSGGYSQETYSKVRINLNNTDIEVIHKLGLETDHGTLQPGVSFVHVFNQSEITRLRAAGIDFKIMVEDVIQDYQHHQHDHQLRNEECPATSHLERYPTPANYRYGSMGGFLTYSEMLVELDRMSDLYPELINVKDTVSQTPTHENNYLLYLKISDHPYMDEEEPEVLYTALHHAREPSSMSQMIFYMWHLLENYETNASIKYLVDHTQMFFIPCINPDGYMYNESEFPEGGGLWRKNRLPNEDPNLVGVDLNRNYGFTWGHDDSGSSPAPISNIYRGPSEFSEPETQAIRDFCVNHDFIITFNYHAHGEYLLHPWGYESLLTEDNDIFKTLGNTMVKQNKYKLGTPLETVGYNANGTSDDWMYGDTTEKEHIYAYTPEVGNGFWPYEHEIDGINKDNVWQNLSMANAVHNFYDYDLVLPKTHGDEELVVFLNVKKVGLKSGNANVLVLPTSEYLDIENFNFPVSLEMGAIENFELKFDISSETPASEILSFKIQLDNGEYIREEEYSFSYLATDNVILLNDHLDNIDLWTSDNTWGITSSDFFSESSSITDSPNGAYENLANNTLVLKESIDLTGLDRAELQFNAKWNIEKDYDYVLLEVSSEGKNWTPQCGLHTNTGTAYQLPGIPLYDGVSESWVRESIDLSEYLDEVIKLRFTLVSDVYISADGMYIDDITVVGSHFLSTSIQDTELVEQINIYPTLTEDYIIIDIDESIVHRDIKIKLLASDGRLITSQMITDHHHKLAIPKDLTGSLVVHIITENGTISKKIIKI